MSVSVYSRLRGLYDRWRENLEDVLRPDALSAKSQWILVGAILAACMAVRVLVIDAPALDRTHWKEIDYLQLSLNYLRHGFDFLEPRISWPAEPPRLTAMELPLVPYVAALGYEVFGYTVYSVRWITLAAFLVTSLYVFRLTSRELGPVVATGAALAASLFPLLHPFRSFLFSDPTVIALSVMAVFYFVRWHEGGAARDGVLACAAFSLAIALKMTPLYLLLPLAWIVYREDGVGAASIRRLVGFTAVALLLPTAWYAYAFHLAESSMDVFGVVPGAGHDKMQTLTMLSDPAWYGTLWDRLNAQILGGTAGVGLVAAGLAAAASLRRGGLFVAYLLAVLAFFAIVAEGQIDAPYRQLTIVPALSVFASLGAVAVAAGGVTVIQWMTGWFRDPKRVARASLVGVLFILGVHAARNRGLMLQHRPASPAHPDRWALGREIRKHTGSGDLLVTAGAYTIHEGGNDLSPVLYHYGEIRGWTLQKGDWRVGVVDSLRARGATHFAAYKMGRQPSSAGFLRTMRKSFPVLFRDRGRGLLLLDLEGARGDGDD